MRKLLLIIVALLVSCCSLYAQNATVTGPKKPNASVSKPKPRAKQRMTNASRRSQKTSSRQKIAVSSPTGYINGHGYVDLGLSVKWATCNIGASSPEEYGYYYSWGETETKNYYRNSKWDRALPSSLESHFVIDSNGNLTLWYDVAHVKWSSSWRMPTKAECEELVNRCTWTWTVGSGYEGYKVKGPNGNSIFLPAAGNCEGAEHRGGGGGYWSSTSYGIDGAWGIDFGPWRHDMNGPDRNYGQSVRAVSD